MKKLFGLIFLFVLFSSCKNEFENTLSTKENFKLPALLLLVDDSNIETFYMHYDYIQTIGLKITFFISQYHVLPIWKKDIIRTFYTSGHEIGYHGTYHICANHYIDKYGINAYINYEILPDFNLMLKDGYNITNFSYPKGCHTAELDSILLKNYFDFIKLGNIQPVYYNLFDFKENRIVRTLAIDNCYDKSTDDIISALKYAADNKKIILLSTHKILEINSLDTVTIENGTTITRFKYIFDYAKSKGFHFYTLKDLRKFSLLYY